MPGEPQPLADNFAIVNEKGCPTEYFIRWAQDRQIDISEGITAEQASELIEDWSANRQIIAGTGLSGGGALSSDVTINLDAELGDLNDVDLSTPPTDGQVIIWDNAAQKWIPADQSGGGGGGSSQLLGISHITLPADFNVATGAWQSPTTWTIDHDPLGAYSVNSDFIVPVGATLVKAKAITSWDSGGSNRAVRITKPDETNVVLLDIRPGVFETSSSIASPLVPVVPGDTLRVAYNSFSSSGNIAGASGTIFGSPCRVELEWYSDYPTPGGGGGGDWWYDPPAAADFPTIVTGNASVPTVTDDSDVGMVLSWVGTSANNDDAQGCFKALPAGVDWTLETHFHHQAPAQNYRYGGLSVRVAGTGKSYTFAMASFVGSAPLLFVLGQTGQTGQSVNTNLWWNATGPIFLKVQWDQATTTLTVFASLNGKLWTQVYQVTSAAFLGAAPDQIGFKVHSAVGGGGATTGQFAVADRWAQSW
jgi:hypothetical protein